MIYSNPDAEDDPQAAMPARPDESTHARQKILSLIVTVILSVTALCLLFVNLGHYAFWDDEAVAALIATGVWHTGDTSAEIDHNIVAYRNGLLIKNTRNGLKDRSSPPLQYYLAAPFLGIFQGSAFAARFPMAMLGAACVALMCGMLYAVEASLGTVVLFSIALAGNVSFFLYFRQCRYYGPTIFLATATVCTYLRARGMVGIALNSVLWVLLFSAHYLTWAAVAFIVAVDYFFWGFRRRRLSGKELAIVLLPQLVIGAVLLFIWNPHSIDAGDARGPWLIDRLTLLWWSIRDCNVCEYGAGLILLIALVIGIWKKNQWIIRGSVALAVGGLVIVILSPQSTSFPGTRQADVRYFCGLIPLCIALETITLRVLVGRFWLAAGVPAAIVLFCTNLLQGGFLLRTTPIPPIRSTLVSYIGELLHPPNDPYTATASWINDHVHDGDSIVVLPDFAVYPLMFHAPKAVYAWQLTADKTGPGFDELPPIDFQNRLPPDYIIAMAQSLPPLRELQLFNIRYQCVAVLNVFGVAAYRPELFWRTFTPPPAFDPAIAGVKIYQRE